MSDQVNKHSDHHLPEEIWNIILLKLPVETILVCISVCRSWNSLINTSTFISSHLQHSMSEPNSSNTPNLCFFKDIDSDNNRPEFSLLLDDEDLTEHTSLIPPPLNFDNKEIDVFGSCNGLILLGECSQYSKKLYLWNPVVRKLVMLPMVDWSKYHYAGLGFDSNANDYIVMVLYLFRKRYVDIGIYSLKSNSWNVMKDVELETKYIRFGATSRVDSMKFLNGFFHVAAVKMSDRSYNILRFDMHNGVCREVMLPDAFDSDDYNVEADFSVRGGGLLTFSCTTCFSFDRVFNVWVMEEYGVEARWIQLVKFPLELSMPEPLFYCFRRNGDALLNMSPEINSFNPSSNEFRNVAVNDEAHDVFFDCCYVQSLALLDIGDSYGVFDFSNDSDADESEEVFDSSNDSDESEEVSDFSNGSNESEEDFDLSNEDSDSDES